ncbi:MAG: hypothetical protein ABWZ76_10025 [Acidimicrobiales bacterium]
MATVIKASCHDCGDVELAVDDLMVRICSEGDYGSYVFRCPSCLMSVAKPAEQRIVDLLIASGVELIEWHLPSELFELHAGAPITHDDLIDFHRLLQGDGWFEMVLNLVPQH